MTQINSALGIQINDSFLHSKWTRDISCTPFQRMNYLFEIKGVASAFMSLKNYYGTNHLYLLLVWLGIDITIELSSTFVSIYLFPFLFRHQIHCSLRIPRTLSSSRMRAFSGADSTIFYFFSFQLKVSLDQIIVRYWIFARFINFYVPLKLRWSVFDISFCSK